MGYLSTAGKKRKGIWLKPRVYMNNSDEGNPLE